MTRKTIAASTALCLLATGGAVAFAQSGTNPTTASGAASVPVAASDAPVAKAHWGGRRDFGRRGGGAMLRVLQQADTNNDGALTQAELDAFRTAQVEAADADDDGNLSLEEFQTIWVSLTRPRMVDAFQRLDEDGDGSVTAEEQARPFANLVERLDRNGDDRLDREDRRRGRGDRGRRGRRDDR